MSPDEPTRDHPQTIKGEPDARGSDAPALDDGWPNEDEWPAQDGGSEPAPDADNALSEGDTETVRHHAQGGRTIADSVGSAGRDVGAGTPGDTGDLGGGDPQKLG